MSMCLCCVFVMAFCPLFDVCLEIIALTVFSAYLFSFSCLFYGLIQIAKRRDKLLNYMLFLRITPTLPNLFINLASPIVDVPFHIFFFATLIGLIPASYITVRVSFSAYLTVILLYSHCFPCSLNSTFANPRVYVVYFSFCVVTLF